jgi:hypothetical protein
VSVQTRNDQPAVKAVLSPHSRSLKIARKRGPCCRRL